ncbi:acid phosphatase type 7-like isoform X1 [Acropora muricata]|uniref:acid phosphatase type 7-like isoform X1 n=2 Tax=Acropora muricata TaxID=159855 RepID=UPI0034E50B07
MEAPFSVTLLFLSLSLTHARYMHNNNPEQIHIAFTGFPSERIINYVTPSPYEKPDTVAVYGTSADKLDKKAYGDSFVFPGPGHKFTIHNVKLTGLKSNTRYYYQVGNPDNGCSEIFSFSTKDGNLIFAVYGDLGSRNAVSLDRLKTEAKNGEYDAIIHVGDFAYDMDKKKGRVGDDFMNAIQPIASRVPYMVLPGNHENNDNFTQYLNRFSNIELGVGQTSGSQTSLWWSMDIGLIHFVCFDTEVYSYYPDEGQIQRQLNWLEADLIKANKQRAKTPWIVSLAHKGFFMEKTSFSHFGPLLHKYGVDLHICGHRHNYQRLYPTYKGKVHHQRKHKYVNPAYMTTIVAGSAGGKERLSHSTAPRQMVAKYLKNYGYGHLQAINRTHLHWKWQNIHDKNRSVFQDHLWLVQENHGRRSRPVQDYQEDNIKQLINDIIQEYEDDIRTESIC